MTTTTPGKIVLPNGAIIVYGYVNASLFTADRDTGANVYKIDLSSYGLTKPVFALTTGDYAGGVPLTSIKYMTNKVLMITSPVISSNINVYWLVIG